MSERLANLRCLLLLGCLASAACASDDVGSACPEMTVLRGSDSSDGADAESISYLEGQRAVEVNALFACDSAVCVATPARGAYCSRPCNSDASCPDGFSCEAIVDFGPHAGATYCVWASCKTDADCGSGDFACRHDAHAEALTGQGVCDHR